MTIAQAKSKVFCLGFGKTGTTTLERVLADFGYSIGDQEVGEFLVDDYSDGNWEPIIEFCHSADAFQDVPFCLPYTWLILHEHFPDARFVLSVRDPEDWYDSLINHHSGSFGDGKNPPTSEQLKRAIYRGKYPEFVYKSVKAIWKNDDADLYNRDSMIAAVQRHNEDVRHFFKGKDNFIEISVENDPDYQRLAAFLEIPATGSTFSHLNRRRLAYMA